MIRAFILLIAFMTGIIYLSYSQDLVTDRPDQTESSSTVPAGILQIESGMVLESITKDGIKEENIIFPTTLFRYGLLKNVELRVLSQYESYSLNAENSDFSYDGFSDIEVGLKIRLLSSESLNTEIAILSHLVVPTGSEYLTNDDYATINKLAVSHTITENIGLGYNLGYDHYGTGNGNFVYSVAFGLGLTPELGAFIEAYGELENMESNSANFDTGITYLVKDNLQLDFSFGTGIEHNMNFLSLGFSWRIDN